MSNSNRETHLNKLNIKMSKDGDGRYRNYSPGTIVKCDDNTCRIDSQTPVNLEDKQPRLNLHFQSGSATLAATVLNLKPDTAPEHLTNEIIDDSEFGFTPKKSELIMSGSVYSISIPRGLACSLIGRGVHGKF
jgi:hypothetical protein